MIHTLCNLSTLGLGASVDDRYDNHRCLLALKNHLWANPSGTLSIVCLAYTPTL